MLSEKRSRTIMASELRAGEGSSKPLPGLADAIDGGAVHLVIDEMGASTAMEISNLNTIVSGNDTAAKSPWRTLNKVSANAPIRVATAWFCSNWRSVLSQLLEGGATRRTKLIATATTYISAVGIASYGGFSDDRAALDAFECDDEAYARQMLEHASVENMPANTGAGDKDERTRASEVGAAWHQLVPERTFGQSEEERQRDASVLLYLVLL